MAKKSVISNRAANPALQFISKPVEEAPAAQPAPAPQPVVTPAAAPAPAPALDVNAPFDGYAIPEGYRLISKETRSHRLQLLLTPTLYDKVKQAATANGLKVNDYIHRVLDMATKDI